VSVTTQPTTFSDLYTLLLNAVRADTSATGTISQAKRAINMALYDMHLGMEYKYPWAERAGRLITQAQYTTGTCSITKGATALTGSGTLWNTANSFGVNNVRANGKFIIGGLTPYVVSSISSDTALTLSSRFTESTITAGTYVYFEDEYDLASDFLRPVDMQRFSDDVSIELISRTEFRRRYPANAVPGRPTGCLPDRLRAEREHHADPQGEVPPAPGHELHDPVHLHHVEPGDELGWALRRRIFLPTRMSRSCRCATATRSSITRWRCGIGTRRTTRARSRRRPSTPTSCCGSPPTWR
jgi:hypothetical protein